MGNALGNTKVDSNNIGYTSFKIIQGVLDTQTATSDGSPLQTYNFQTDRPIENDMVYVFVNGEPYDIKDSLYDMTKDQKQCMVKTGVAGGIDDKIGIAAGNYAGDAMANLLNNGKKAQLPPKPDFAALGTELAVDVADRALGAVLPQPMIPTKVASEFESWYSSASQMASATNVNLSLELNTNKKVIELVNKSKAKGFAANLLKSNKNALAQTKDFLISAASGIVNGLVKAGVSSLVRASVTALTKQKMANISANNCSCLTLEWLTPK
jgi:hypothetical protein